VKDLLHKLHMGGNVAKGKKNICALDAYLPCQKQHGSALCLVFVAKLCLPLMPDAHSRSADEGLFKHIFPRLVV